MATEVKKWSFLIGDGAISEEGTDDIIMYIDDINPEIIEKYVQMKNEEYSPKKMVAYLDEEIEANRLTPDEKEHLIVSTEQWENLQNARTDTPVQVVPIQKETPFEGDIVQPKEPLTEKLKQEVMDTVTGKKTRGPKTTGNGTGKKKVSVESLEAQIEALQEKKMLIGILATIQAPEFPTDLSAAGRKVMIDLQKEFKVLVDKHTEIIMEM